ncbi:hypothetical protein HNY73_011596, partial [Argiope bruennichi]
MLRTDQAHKVVIRGLPPPPIEEIKEDLEREGFTVVSITQLSKFQTKSPMPLFYAQIANGPLSETVYTLTEMFGTKISVERYRAKRLVQLKQPTEGKSYASVIKKSVSVSGTQTKRVVIVTTDTDSDRIPDTPIAEQRPNK